jgi:hypothetical protein
MMLLRTARCAAHLEKGIQDEGGDMDAKDAYKVVVITPDGTKTEASGRSMLCVVRSSATRGDVAQQDLQTLISGKEEDLLAMVLHMIESIELKGCDNFGATVQKKLKEEAHYTGYIRV